MALALRDGPPLSVDELGLMNHILPVTAPKAQCAFSVVILANDDTKVVGLKVGGVVCVQGDRGCSQFGDQHYKRAKLVIKGYLVYVFVG